VVEEAEVVLQATGLPFITKVLIPKRRDYIVRRERLLASLKAGVSKKVQIVCAPAGYGKTALLVDFVREVELPVCWYSFAPEDYDPISFLRYCIRPIQTRFPDFGARYPDLLRGGLNQDWLTQVGLFTSALHSDIAGRLVFVFDDLHWIQGGHELEQALSLLIQRASTNVHFVLASRVQPSLPSLPKLAAEGDLGFVDANELRFSTEDTVQLLTNLWDRDVTTGEAEAVNYRTRGWAAAIMLAARSQTAPAQANSTSFGEEGLLFHYLSEEVFDKLPEPLQSFLLQTSILREFTGRFCDRILDLFSSEDLIREIKVRGLFLQERGMEAASYEYHDLFREYLEHRFQSEHPLEFQRLHVRAAAIYADLGNEDAAIHHFLKAGEPGKAIEMVKRVATSYFDQGRWQKLGSWLDSLPQDAVEKDPALLLLRGLVLLRLGDPTGSLTQLDKLVTGPHATDSEILGKALVAKSTAYRRLGHFDLASKAAREGLSILSGVNCPPADIAEAFKQLGNVCHAQGDYLCAKQNYEAGLALISKEHLRLFSLICHDLGVVYMELGELDQAATSLEEARTGLLKLGSHGPLAEALVNISLVYYHQGEFDLALDEVSEALRIAQAASYPRVVATALMNQALFQRALGAYSDSLSSASRALNLARDLLDLRLIAASTTALGNAYRKFGETSKAEVLLRQALTEAENSGQQYIASSYHISLGKLYCQTGAYTTALNHLRLAEDKLTELNSPRRIAEVKLFQAASLYRSGQIKEAAEYLVQVAQLVSTLGYDGSLLADGQDVLDVLRFGAAKRIGQATFAHLVGRLTQTRQSAEQPDGPRDQAGTSACFPAVRAFGFGSPRVVLDSHEVTDAEWRSRKAKELFFFLLSNRGFKSNEEIVEALWPAVSLDLSESTLKTNIYRLRQALFFDCISARDSGYSLNPQIPIECDVENFLLHLRLGSRNGSNQGREEQLLKAIEFYQGTFLNGFHSEWCHRLRTDLELKYHTALMTLASYHISRGNSPQAAELLERVVELDSFNEEAQLQLINCYLQAKDPFLALQHLRKYAKISREELGADLPARFADCHRSIMTLISQ
jgi:ATP/maltotriose-dependent transcriptional regulator MalT/DNA-binding SARP family transcriptional activator